MKRRSFKIWTKEEIEFLKNNFGKIYAKDIAAILNVSISRIIHKAYELKLKSNLTKFSTVEERLKFCKCKLIGTYIGCKKKHRFSCGYCGNEFITTPQKILSKHTKSCGCLKNKSKENSGYFSKRKGGKYISGTYFTSIKQGAKIRNIEFSVSIEMLENILIEQDFKCKLSGRDLVFGYINIQNYTASLDRIDSTKGYIANNVQWVDKQVNMSKQQYNQEDFIKMCIDVANFQRKI